MASRFASQIRTNLTSLGVSPTAPLVLAVSGGADSLSLLLAVSEWSASRVCAVYVDHQLRPDTAGEAAFVEATALRLGARFHRAEVNVPALMRERGRGLEEAARVGRYEALSQAARAVGSAVVATGHTADDQAETVLWRLLRGGALASLSGMPAERPLNDQVRLLRPMLSLRRSEARRYLSARGERFIEDPSNESLDLTRNRIRRDILPMLQRENPRLLTSLAELADEARGYHTLVSGLVAQRSAALIIARDDRSVTFTVRGLAAEDGALLEQVIQSALPNPLSRGQLTSVLRLLRSEGGRRITLQGGTSARREGDHLIISWGILGDKT